MTAHFNIDEVVKDIKTIADNNRCGTCDKLSGDRLRYPCGHTICGECVVEADDCLTCTDTSNQKPVLDVVQGQLVQNVSNLLTTFQETFNIDVYRRSRLSEKLKVERQLFPECIQASVKYYNKRRSSHISISDDKENSFAGEHLSTSHSTTMNTRINLVKKWLEKNGKENETTTRKPFSDINVNSSTRSNRQNKTNKDLKLHNQRNDFNKKSKKRINIETNNSAKIKNKKKSKDVLSQSLLKYYDSNKIKNKSKSENRFDSDKKYDKSLKVPSDCYEHENNSNVDHLETIVIEDTQTQVDKDKVAWLKVVEAHDKETNYHFKDKPNNSLEHNSLSRIQDELRPDNTRKNVYFYKKDFLFKSCHLCLRNEQMETIRLENQRLNSNNVSITVNTNSISSTITVLRDDEDYIDKMITKHSVETQTDESDIKVNTDEPKPYLTSSPYRNISSPDLFVDDVKKCKDEKHYAEIVNDHDIETTRDSNSYHFINDSDSDADMNFSGPIKVSVDVHRPNETDGILSTVDSADYQSRPRRSGRRRTVDSNNSSEKENVEPNRIKRPRLGKKQGLKK